MQVILREPVSELGNVGDVVTVADGYARNYLLPKRLAVKANPKNAQELEHQKRLIERYKLKVRQDAATVAQRLESVSLTIPMMVGEQDKLFGSVTARDLEAALSQEGISISRKHFVMDEPIKSLGIYTIDVRLHPEVVGKLKVWVVAK
jgi:large subunit ribosomal protein L9